MRIGESELVGVYAGYILGRLGRPNVIDPILLKRDLNRIQLKEELYREGLAVELIAQRFTQRNREILLCVGAITVLFLAVTSSNQFPPSLSIPLIGIIGGWAQSLRKNILNGSDALAARVIEKSEGRITLVSLGRKLKGELSRQYPGESEKVEHLMSLWNERVHAKLDQN